MFVCFCFGFGGACLFVLREKERWGFTMWPWLGWNSLCLCASVPWMQGLKACDITPGSVWLLWWPAHFTLYHVFRLTVLTEILHSLLLEAERRPIGCCNCLGVIRMCFPKVVVLGVWYLLWQCWAGKPRGWKLVGILRSLGAGTCSEETNAVLKKFQLDPRKVNYCKKSELLGWVPGMPHTHACTGRASDH